MGFSQMNKPFLSFVIGSLFALPCSNHATQITMDTSIEITNSNGTFSLSALTVNNGDEGAKKVWFEVPVQGRVLTSPISKYISPGETFTWSETLNSITGNYRQIVLPVITHYSDINLYPFSALSYAQLNNGTPVPSRVFIKMKPITISTEGELPLSIRSTDADAHQISVRIYAPKEISIDPMAIECLVPPTGTTQMTVQVGNFSALPNSSYALLVVASEVTTDGIVEEGYYGRVNIQRIQDTIWMRTKPVIVMLIGIFLVAFIMKQLPAIIRSLRKT